MLYRQLLGRLWTEPCAYDGDYQFYVYDEDATEEQEECDRGRDGREDGEWNGYRQEDQRRECVNRIPDVDFDGIRPPSDGDHDGGWCWTR